MGFIRNMRYLQFVMVLAVVIFVQACTSTEPAKKSTPVVNPKAPETSSIAPAVERDILFYINKHRKSKGLPEFGFNAIIAAEARRHSTDMASRRVPFGHQGLTTRTKNITGKIKSVNAVSENVARGPITAEQAVNLWLKSDGHRKNIEGNYRYTGVGVARDRKSELYFTQIFAN
jgi:uncharacterized protein YkwD